ncbi:MAG: DNA cytosine methyltransferase [Candidatus Nanoarchaeia archaeon]|nr:DNA cytosine methyltransferase [Candidatus Nanoarchaeia archaeon]
MDKLNVLDLFCGAGGMSFGFKKAGFNIVLGVESNKNAINTFKINHKNSEILCKDIREVSSLEIKKIMGHSKIDVIVGGPPCQGFSMAGKRIPSDPRNSLFKEYLRLVKELKPKIFVMENVRGLLSMKDSKGIKVIEIILKEFRKIGFKTNYYKVNAADYGVPQKRHRIFIIGTQKEYNFNFPRNTHTENEGLYNKIKLKKWVGIKNILINRKELNQKYFYSQKLIKGFKRRQYLNKLKNIGFGWQFLNPNKPSYTISARYWKDGAEALIKYKNNKIRMLTPQECALIQTFPKNYKFFGSEREIYTQIGNAVPPLLSSIIAKKIKEILIIQNGKN